MKKITKVEDFKIDTKFQNLSEEVSFNIVGGCGGSGFKTQSDWWLTRWLNK